METKIVQDLEEAKENDVVYDIDKGISLLKEFIKKTAIHTKEFYKISKKMKGRDAKEQKKQLFKFSKEKLLNSFNFSFSSKFFILNELDFLEEEVLHNYILGIFISGHSNLPNVKNNLDKILANTIYEISQRSFKNRTEGVS